MYEIKFPNKQIMFNIMRACIAAEKPKDLWLRKIFPDEDIIQDSIDITNVPRVEHTEEDL